MIDASIPVNKKQLGSFLGLITYYGRFSPDRAKNLEPLCECVNLDKFEWKKECNKSFTWVKLQLVLS